MIATTISASMIRPRWLLLRWPQAVNTAMATRIIAISEKPNHSSLPSFICRVPALGTSQHRPPGPDHACTDRRRDHVGLPHRIHPHGAGRVLRLAFLPLGGSGYGLAAGARPFGATPHRRGVVSRADCDNAFCIYGPPCGAPGP